MTDSTIVQFHSNTSTEIANFLREHEEIETIVPVLIGLLITSRFQLRGANALLVNLGVATVCGQLFRELKKTPTTATTSRPPSQPSLLENEEVKIVHKIPGRIRLRIPRIKEDAIFAKRLKKLLGEDENVMDVRVNHTVASVVINYNAAGSTELELGLRLREIIEKAKQENHHPHHPEAQ
ncbi:MAG: metal ABC transporter ATPase [Geminocystis sp.]|nr:metal ABC transporter ATPase [Geminocystis sp.]